MDAETSAAVAAIAAAVSAVLTLIIAKANYSTARTDAKAADFDSCLDVVTKLADAQRLVRDAAPGSVKEFEFRELLNLMEALALLENDKRIAPSTRKFTEHFLVEAWAYLRSDASLHVLVASSITGAETFSELTKFAARHVSQIEKLTKVYECQRQNSSTDGPTG